MYLLSMFFFFFFSMVVVVSASASTINNDTRDGELSSLCRIDGNFSGNIKSLDLPCHTGGDYGKSDILQ